MRKPPPKPPRLLNRPPTAPNPPLCDIGADMMADLIRRGLASWDAERRRWVWT